MWLRMYYSPLRFELLLYDSSFLLYGSSFYFTVAVFTLRRELEFYTACCRLNIHFLLKLHCHIRGIRDVDMVNFSLSQSLATVLNGEFGIF